MRGDPGSLKAKIWIGLPLAVAGGYLLGDTTARLRLAGEVLGTWWPWALLALAAVNLLRSTLRLESLLAPSVLAFAAVLGLALRDGVAARTLLDIVIPAVIAVTGMLLLLSAGSGLAASWTRILTTGRVVARSSDVLQPRAILGELKADLSLLDTPPSAVRVTAVFGHVHLTIPDGWRVDLHSAGAPLTPIRGLIGTGETEIRLRVLGFCGIVTVSRTNPARRNGRKADPPTGPIPARPQ
ncbi:hypothetical protein [Amycolatopsis sp. NPDC059657]|uniref:hypothetical protein n=1 Tax=Amycolatopsis sp. NPDC059657 TaxID=3346899 RepID=UPI003671B46F